MRLNWGLAILGAVSLCGGLAGIARAETIGTAASVVPAADFTRDNVIRTLTINEALEQDDRIRTSSNGSIRVRFLDDTLLTIGPDSEILLDKFVFDGTQAKNLSIEVLRGAMRFVSGTSPHNVYEIKTPVATIGVRGTVVDIGYVNGHWIHNTIDGGIIGCIRGTSTCQNYKAGDLAFSIGPSGFISINASDVSKLFNKLDQSHFTLAHAVGQDPGAPTGAAAGQGGATGSTGGNPGNNGGNPGGTPGGPGNDNSNTNLGGCTSNCSPPPPPPPPPPCTTPACLGVVTTASGPAFPSFVDFFRITGTGGDNVLPQNTVVNDNNNLRVTDYLYAQRSNTT